MLEVVLSGRTKFCFEAISIYMCQIGSIAVEVNVCVRLDITKSDDLSVNSAIINRGHNCTDTSIPCG